MTKLDSQGVANLLSVLRGGKFRAKRERPKGEGPRGPLDGSKIGVATGSTREKGPIAEYYICRRRLEGYPSLCKMCKPSCSREAFKSHSGQVIRALEEYCQKRDAPSPREVEVMNAVLRRYDARKRGATPSNGGLTTKEWRAILESYKGRCAYCGGLATSQDHVVPISRGGAHCASNVVPACGFCNSSKGAKEVSENQLGLAL